MLADSEPGKNEMFYNGIIPERKKMKRKTMYLDVDAINKLVYGSAELVEGLNHADFSVRLRDAIQNGGEARRRFRESDLDILTGSIQLLSGVTQILADGLVNGDLDLDYSGD